MKHFINYFLLLLVLPVFSQSPSEFQGIKQKYSNAHLVGLRNESIVSLDIKKGILEVNEEVFEDKLYLNETATQHSKRSLNFSSFFEMDQIMASTFIPDGNRFRELKVNSFNEKDDLSSSFYDDTKTLSFIYPDLREGAITRLKYSQKIKNPRFLTPFYFGDYYPLQNNKLTIIAHKDISFDFKEFNLEGFDIVYSEISKGNNRIYTWKLNGVAEFKNEHSAPSYKTVIPHIIPVITSYKVNGSTVEVLGDATHLYKWYHSLVRDINRDEPAPSLVTLVEELTTGKESNLEKVKSIYYWTQENIKYIAFEYALGGFIPREANIVFQKKYGDCKDNSSILHEMLEIAGIKGQLTWIGTRSLPYTYDQVPTPLVDNHMILAYEEEEEIYYLDATGRYLPIELPASFIQGKEALIAQDNGKFKILKVPVVPSEKNKFTEISKIDLQGEDLTGSSAITISGYTRIDLLQELEDIPSREKVREFYNHALSKGNNSFLIGDFKESNKLDYDKDLKLNVDFSIRSYAKSLGDEIYINLNLNKDLTSIKTPAERENAIEYDYKISRDYTTVLNIPEGYEIDYLPEDLQLENEFISTSITYQKEEDKIIYNHSFNLDFLTLELEGQKEVNSLIRKVEKAYKDILVLKKSSISP